MSTRSQKREAVEVLVSVEFEPTVDNSENIALEQVPGPSNLQSPKIRRENLDEIETSLSTEVMSGLAKILAENQKEVLRLIAPAVKRKNIPEVVSDTDSEAENISPVVPTSTP